MNTQNEAVTAQPNGADMLAKWDEGELVWTVEMGGLGPGYEQAIQTAVIEIIRDNVGKELPAPSDAEDWGDDTLRKHNASLGGMSGAQAGAAKSLAYRILRDGHEATLDSIRAHDKDRLTMVSKSWPQAAPGGK